MGFIAMKILLLEKFLAEAAGDLSERDIEALKEVFELHDGDPSSERQPRPSGRGTERDDGKDGKQN